MIREVDKRRIQSLTNCAGYEISTVVDLMQRYCKDFNQLSLEEFDKLANDCYYEYLEEMEIV